MLMGKGRPGNCSTTELLPRLVEQIGVEPMTDNPMSSAHQRCWCTASKNSAQRAMVDVDRRCIRLSYSC